MLEVLEELHIVPDLVVGTSMGSIVGGLYAAGWSAAEIQAFLESMDWSQVFTDRVARRDKSFHRKQDDTLYLIQAKLRFQGLKPYLPPGFLGGQRLELMLKSLEFASTAEHDFDRFPIPYRAVAVDIGTGQAVVLGEGSLATAMRASMSIGGAFAPVELDGRKLVDGGAVANLPVRIAQRLGARRIIAVDISSPLSGTEEIGTFLSVMGQTSGLLTVGNVQEDIQALAPDDIYMRPDLGEIGFADFKRAAETVVLGEAAAREQVERLRPFAASDEAWSAFLARRAERPPAEFTVDEVRIDNTSWVDDEVIRRRLEIEPGTELDEAGLAEAVMRLKALDYFGTITPEYERTGDTRVLALDVPKKPHGRNLMQFGITLETDRTGGRHSQSGFEITARHQMLAVNRRGGEWENLVRVGTNGALSTRFYQPLDLGMRWFVDTTLQHEQTNPTLWVDGAPVARYELLRTGARLEIGRVFERWGEIRVGPYSFDNRAYVDIGEPLLPELSERDAGVRALFRVDTQDTTAFPRHGELVELSYELSSNDLGSDGEVERAIVSFQKAITQGRNTITLGAEAAKNFEPVTLYELLYALGGAFRLSGLGEDELLGEMGGLVRAGYFGEITRLDIGPLKVRVLAGMSLEAGQVYLRDDPVTWDSLRYGGTLYLGAETPFGPAFLGWGYTDEDRQRFYVSIGQRY